MNWSPDKWLAPRFIETPDLVKDINQFIADGFTENMFDCMKFDARQKLSVLVERLEFIEHLDALLRYIENFKNVDTSLSSLPDGKIKVIQTYSIKIEGHDFAGFDFDSDALIIYLLLTCIDTIKGQAKYINAFEWLKEKCSDTTSFNWDNLSNEYDRNYGLSKRFKEAFTIDCSPAIKKILAEDFAVIKIASQNIKTESATAWEKRSEIQRVERIASQLYTIRSSFTHASIRSFSPVVPLCNSMDAEGSILLQRKDGCSLRVVLLDIIKQLSKDLIINSEYNTSDKKR